MSDLRSPAPRPSPEVPPALPHDREVRCPDGPLLLRGPHVVSDADGVEHPTTRPVSAVCRCGHSAVKPWCDGTHKVVRPGWEATEPSYAAVTGEHG